MCVDTHITYLNPVALDLCDPVILSFLGNFLLVLSEMRGNEGWDFGLRGHNPCSPTARLPGICRRLRTQGHWGGEGVVIPHRGAMACEGVKEKEQKENIL